jgi:hypothetical protein
MDLSMCCCAQLANRGPKRDGSHLVPMPTEGDPECDESHLGTQEQGKDGGHGYE